MAYKNISASLSEENKTQVIQKLKEVESLLPFIVDLSPEERKTIPTLGRKSLKKKPHLPSKRKIRKQK